MDRADEMRISKKDRHLPARLLSKRRGLLVDEKDEVLKRVLKTVRQEEGRPRHPWFAPVYRPVLIGVSAVVAVALSLWLGLPSEPQQEFRAKGEGGTLPFFSITCLDGDGQLDCRTGAKLVFSIRPVSVQRFFSAFARRKEDGLVIWYFPEKTIGTALPVAPAVNREPLARGVLLGPEHRPGSYRITGLLSDSPLSREQIRRLFESKDAADSAPFDSAVEISVVELEVRP